MVSTRMRQAAAFGAFSEGGESCRWGRGGAARSTTRGVGAIPIEGETTTGVASIAPRGGRAADGRGTLVTRVLEVLLPLSSTRRPSQEACTTKNAIVVRSARRATTRRGTGNGRRMWGGRWRAPLRDWVVAAATHTRVATAVGAGNRRAGLGGGGRARARACMWAAMRASHLAAGADIGDLDDHGWIARRGLTTWAMCLHHACWSCMPVFRCTVTVSSRSHARQVCSMLKCESCPVVRSAFF